MFSTNTDGQSGELVDLMSYLEAEYRKKLVKPDAITIEGDSFIKWAKKHLSEVRPSEVFAVDNNYGVLLTDGQRVKLCPDTAPTTTGDMANADTSLPAPRLS